MKRLIITAMLLVSIHSAYSQVLLDSLKGHWTVTQMTSNKKNNLKSGTLFFSDDGKFVSSGNHFGATQALYTTNETTSTIQIESANKAISEWEAQVKNGVLYLTNVNNAKKKQPVVKITAVRKEP